MGIYYPLTDSVIVHIVYINESNPYPPYVHFSYPNLLSTFANPPNHPFLRPPSTLLSARVTYECTTSPVSLTNLQVSVGGQNVLQSTLHYGYEHFLEQVNLAQQLTSSDFGISTGLIDQNYWEKSKWYWVNVERASVVVS